MKRKRWLKLDKTVTFSPCDSLLFLQVLETPGIILGPPMIISLGLQMRAKWAVQVTHFKALINTETVPDPKPHLLTPSPFSLFLLFSSPTSKPPCVQLFSAVDFAYSWLCISAGFASFQEWPWRLEEFCRVQLFPEATRLEFLTQPSGLCSGQDSHCLA